MIALSFLEAALLVIILSIGLNQVRKRLITISEGLGTLGGALAMVETNHLRGLMQWVLDINAPLQVIAGVLPGIAAKAALVVRKAQGEQIAVDAALAVLTIGVMAGLGAIALHLLTRMLGTIRELRGITTGLNDTMRWAVGQVASQPAARVPGADAPGAGAGAGERR